MVMRAAPRIALLCLALPRAILAADTADIDFLNLQGDIRIAKKERQNLERKVDAQNGDLARRLEAALAPRLRSCAAVALRAHRHGPALYHTDPSGTHTRRGTARRRAS